MAIRELTQFEHIRQNQSMYISRSDCPIHLLWEIIDNAADELISGYAFHLEVTVDNVNHIYSVTDDGRGIPITSSNFSKEVPIVIATTMYSGGKFDNDLYNAHAGLHGMGLSIVNALSNQLIITVKSGRKHRRYTFNSSDDQNIIPENIKKENYSTKVEFHPAGRYFDTLDIDKTEVIERLKCISASSNKDASIILHYNDQDIIIENDLIKNYTEKCTEYIDFNMSGERESDGKLIQDTMDVYIGYASDIKTSKFSGIVNTLSMNKGHHQKFIENAVIEYLYDRAVKNDKHVQKSDMLLGSNIFCIAKISNPSFTGQSKYELSGKSDRYSHLFKKEVIFKELDKHPEFTDSWINLIEEYRMNLDTSKNLKVKKSRNKVDVEDLKDCTSKVLEERELYIVEGQSAGGTLLQSRDVKRHAVLPLRGKILNVLNASFDKILKSETLAKIFNTIGIRPNDPDINKIRYGKVIILTDPDKDGGHISALLVSFFNKFAKSLIDEGKLYVSIMPLYGVTLKKKFIPIYDDAELSKYRGKEHITRYKGLGEMDASELKVCAFDEDTRRLIKVIPSEEGTIENIWNNKKDIISEYSDIF